VLASNTAALKAGKASHKNDYYREEPLPFMAGFFKYEKAMRTEEASGRFMIDKFKIPEKENGPACNSLPPYPQGGRKDYTQPLYCIQYTKTPPLSREFGLYGAGK
jgi:hypothetical protein